MKKNLASQSSLFNPRVLVASALCSAGGFLAMLGSAAMSPSGVTQANARQTSSPPEWTQFSVVPAATPNPNCLPDSLCPDWTATYDGPGNGYDRAVGTLTSPDGTRLYVTGISTGASGDLDFATVTYDAATGQQIWVTRYDGPAHASDQPFYFGTGKQIAISADGSTIFVIGLSGRADGNNDYVTIAYRANDGMQLWVSRYSTPLDSIATSLAVSGDGKRLYVTGYSAIAIAPPPAPGADNYDFATVAYDTTTGDQLWVARYDGPPSFWDVAYDIGVGAVPQLDGSRREQVFVTGRSNGASSANSDADFATVAYDGLTGAELWVARYNGPANDRDLAYALTVSPDGSSIFITGESAGNGAVADYATISYDALTGAQRWLARYDNGDLDLPLGVVVSPTGDRVAITGFSVNPIGGVGFIPLRDAATILYDSATGAQIWVARHSEVDGAAASHVIYSRDGRRLYISGLENGNVIAVQGVQAGHSPALTVAYDAAGGTELWTTHYSGPSGDEGNFGMAVSPDDAHVFVTGGGQSTAADFATLSYSTGAPTPPPVQLVRAVSRKTHGDAGAFDIDLISVIPEYLGIECRSGGPDGEYTLVFTFANRLTSVGTAKLTSGMGSVSSSAIDRSDAHNYIVNLTSVTDAQVLTIGLGYVYDSTGNGSNAVSASMGILLGDTNKDGRVNVGDTNQTKSLSGQPLTDGENFRSDVNLDGRINVGDTNFVKAHSGNSLP